MAGKDEEKPSILERLCAQLPIVGLLFIGGVVGLVLTIASLLAVDPNSTTYVVVWLNIVGLVFIISWTGYVIYRCRRILSPYP